LALGTPEHSLHAFHLLLLNVVGLDLIGSIAILAIRGVRLRDLQREKQIRHSVAVALDVVPGFDSVGSTVDVTLLGEREASIEVVCRRQFGGKVPETLAEEIVEQVANTTGCSSTVSVEVIPVLVHSNLHEARTLPA
jgi:uncharacterized alkaline shock family protein YloU